MLSDAIGCVGFSWVCILFFIYLFFYFAKTMLYSIKLRQNINMHGLLETAGYINTSYADPWAALP